MIQIRAAGQCLEGQHGSEGPQKFNTEWILSATALLLQTCCRLSKAAGTCWGCLADERLCGIPQATHRAGDLWVTLGHWGGLRLGHRRTQALLHPDVLRDSWNALPARSCFPCGTDLEICGVVLIHYWLLKETHDLRASILKATCEIRYCLKEEGFASVQGLLYEEKPLLGFCLSLAKNPQDLCNSVCFYQRLWMRELGKSGLPKQREFLAC